MTTDEQHAADQLAEILEAVAPFDQGTVKGVLFQKPRAGQGPFTWISEIFPPFDLSAIYNDMKEAYGGGDYRLQIFAGGKLRKNHDFTIIRERAGATPAAVAAPAGLGAADLVAMLLSQQAEARRESQAAADRQTTMFTAMITAIVPVVGAVLTRPPAGGGTSETVALIAALQDRKGGGMTEMIQGLAALKALADPPAPPAGEGGGGLDLDDLAGTAVRLIGPGVRAVGDYMARQRQAAGGSEAGGHSASLAAAPGAGDQLALGPPASRFPLIDLVRDDVTYMFARGFDPAKAADLVYDIIEANNVSEGEVDAIAAAFALSPNGLEDLAKEGIDLRSRPSWAAEFFTELHAIHTAPHDDPAGAEGGAGDAAANGAPGEGGTP